MDKNLLLTIFLVAAGCAWQLFGGEARVCEGRRGVFSPDGSRIAFECERGGRLAVGFVPVKGGDAEWVASGPAANGAGATITVTDPSLLDRKTSYRLYTATATSGTPELVGFPRGWMAMNDGVSLRVLYASGTTILFR